MNASGTETEVGSKPTKATITVTLTISEFDFTIRALRGLNEIVAVVRKTPNRDLELLVEKLAAAREAS